MGADALYYPTHLLHVLQAENEDRVWRALDGVGEHEGLELVEGRVHVCGVVYGAVCGAFHQPYIAPTPHDDGDVTHDDGDARGYSNVDPAVAGVSIVSVLLP